MKMKHSMARKVVATIVKAARATGAGRGYKDSSDGGDGSNGDDEDK